MTPSRKGDSGRSRTPAERERDRQERDRRRARERGASSPLDGDPTPIFDPAEPDWVDPDYAGEPSSAGYDQPPAGYDPSSAGSDQPPAGYDPSSVGYDQPPAGYDDAQPAAYDAPPPAQPGSTGANDPYAAGRAPSVDESFADGGRPPSTRPAARRRPPSGAADRLPAAFGRASAGLSGAVAAARSRAPATLSRLRSKDAGPADAGSLPGSVRTRTTRRPPGSRPRTTPVSKTMRNFNGPGAPTSRRGRIAAVVALLAVVFALWFLFSLFQPFKGGGHGTIGVEIPAGSSSSQIGTLLADRGVVSSAFFFKLRAALAGKRSQLESGHFDLRRDMSYGAALDALTGHKGLAAQITVTIPEGLSRTEIAGVAKRDGVSGNYVRASVHSHLLKPTAFGGTKAHSLEGFLFPSTYDLLPGDPASKLVNAQLAAFKTNIGKVDLRRARVKHLSTYDVLTIASMIEREAQLPKERKLIAAVIYNRLRSGMPLGIDATIRYAIGDYSRPLTDSDLKLASPYNTRLHKGLPPTPIGNPGLASIDAAAHPAAVSYQYYVVKPGTCGEHAFSNTFAQFQQDVARYNNARSAKGGKSPTTCAK